MAWTKKTLKTYIGLATKILLPGIYLKKIIMEIRRDLATRMFVSVLYVIPKIILSSFLFPLP